MIEVHRAESTSYSTPLNEAQSRKEAMVLVEKKRMDIEPRVRMKPEIGNILKIEEAEA